MNALLLERHDWETSGSQHQVQVPKAAFSSFFGGAQTTTITASISDPPTAASPYTQDVLLSYYLKSGTHRFNLVGEFGALGNAVIVVEETGAAGHYNIWWFTGSDAQTVLSRPFPWQQAKSNQHGPGRFWAIIPAPGPRTP
jgi:hypothetical protein